MNGFLDEAFEEAVCRVRRWRSAGLLEKLCDTPVQGRNARSFVASLRESKPLALIAEIKRASPSGGMLRQEVDPPRQARTYLDSGAAAVSVLTESRWFGGSLDDFVAVRQATSGSLLRKDFIVDEYDIEISAAIGADAVLLIAARFDSIRLRELLDFARHLGMETLVETHSERDAAVACEAGATIIGINSRNLQTLEVSLNTALRALERIPSDRVRVLESGIRSVQDVRAAVESGADAVLVGEVLMRSSDPATTIRSLLSDAAQSPERMDSKPAIG